MVALSGQSGVNSLGKKVYLHICDLCGRMWTSREKADMCENCGGWDVPAENLKAALNRVREAAAGRRARNE